MAKKLSKFSISDFKKIETLKKERLKNKKATFVMKRLIDFKCCICGKRKATIYDFIQVPNSNLNVT